MTIYMEQTLNLMLQHGMKEAVNKIVQTGIHRNRKKVNYIIVKNEN
jgi:hypothetical protein